MPSTKKAKKFKVKAPTGFRRGARFSVNPSFDENDEPVVVTVQFDDKLEAEVDETTADRIRQYPEFTVTEVKS